MQDEKQDSPKVIEKKTLEKLKKVLKIVGRSAAEKILLIVYALKSEKTPGWAKGVLLSALVYFLTPLDAVPDFIPGAGYADDITVILTALGYVAASIDDGTKNMAKDKIDEWWPEPKEKDHE